MQKFHPEGIPWPGSALYGALSKIAIFQRHYELVARDIARYGPLRCLLDIGTGPGHLLLALRRTFPDACLVGVDISPAMVVQARQNLEAQGPDPRILVHIAGAKALPFPEGSFDRVVSTGSLHHWKDPLEALSEIHRVLRVDGYALLYDLVRNLPQTVREEVRAQFGGLRLALLWLHSFEEPFLDVEEMVAWGRETDFRIEGTHFAGALGCLVLRKGAQDTAPGA